MPRFPLYDPAMSAPNANPDHPRRPSAPLPAVAIAISRYNATITDRLLEGAIAAYQARGGDPASLAILDAPGSFELPALALSAARTGRFAGIVALGCLIHGDTRHDRYIAQAAATGLVNITIATGIPITFGILTCETAKQAAQRAGGSKGNKGHDAMTALLDTINSVLSLHEAIRTGHPLRSAAPIAAPDKARPSLSVTAVGGR
jgi:6,7-dimethyl-8-ribityllumazine synthase